MRPHLLRIPYAAFRCYHFNSLRKNNVVLSSNLRQPFNKSHSNLYEHSTSSSYSNYLRTKNGKVIRKVTNESGKHSINMMMMMMSSSAAASAMIYYSYVEYEKIFAVENVCNEENQYEHLQSAWDFNNGSLPARKYANDNDNRGNHAILRNLLQESFLPSYRTFTHLDSSEVSDKKEEGIGKDRFLRLDQWKRRWLVGTTGWHINHVHPIIIKYYDKMFPHPQKSYHVMIPLCGKTVDMAYIAKDTNKYVVGIDVSSDAIQQFIEENAELDITPSKSSISTSYYDMFMGKHITLYCGDYFQLTDINVVKQCSLEHKFDVIWDRGSLVAIHPSLRRDYATVIGNVVSYDDGVYLLTTFQRTKQNDTSPPYHISEDDINNLFGSLPWVKSITVLEIKPMTYDSNGWYETLYSWYRFGWNAKEVTYYIQTQHPEAK